MLLQLGAWNGNQEEAVAARVIRKQDHDTWNTTGVCLYVKLQHYHFTLVKDERVRPDYLFAKLTNVVVVAELHGAVLGIVG